MRAWVLVVAACGQDTHFVDAAQCTPAIVYLNKDGGSYDHARAIDDAGSNLSLVVDGPRQLAPWPGHAQSWADVTACIRDALAPFAVQVTEQDPGTAAHYELVFTDVYWVDRAVTHV